MSTDGEWCSLESLCWGGHCGIGFEVENSRPEVAQWVKHKQRGSGLSITRSYQMIRDLQIELVCRLKSLMRQADC